MVKKRLENPCVRHCCLNEQDICLGCGRHLYEILNWSASSLSQRQEILERCHHRLKSLQLSALCHYRQR